MRTVFVTALAAGAAGHGYMTYPPTRQNGTLEQGGSCNWPGEPLTPQSKVRHIRPDGTIQIGINYGSCLWFNQGCTIGCEKCGSSDGPASCDNHGQPTIPKEFWTYGGQNTHPWQAPGSAPIIDPCGRGGGAGDDRKPGKPVNGGDPAYGYQMGDKGSDLPPGPVTNWEAGSTVEVAWAITANHGGGYQYRLCPKSSPNQTEACYQKTPLKFVGDTFEIRYTDKSIKSQFFPNMILSTGTVPKGSTWMRNPIPACAGGGGAVNFPLGGCSTGDPVGWNFPAPGPDLKKQAMGQDGAMLAGFGGGSCDSGLHGCTEKEFEQQLFQWNIVDKVEVPKDIAPGAYTLSFRWDSDQTPQIWSSCAEIMIA